MGIACNLFVGLGRVGVVRALLEAGADAAVSHKDGCVDRRTLNSVL